jgi:hypothetical protein
MPGIYSGVPGFPLSYSPDGHLNTPIKVTLTVLVNLALYVLPKGTGAAGG